VTLWCSFMKYDGCQRGTWGGTPGGYKDQEGYEGYGGYGECAWGVVSGVPGLGTHLRNTIEHDSIYKEWSDSIDTISDYCDSYTGSTGDSIPSNSSKDSKDIVTTMSISFKTQDSTNCHKKLQRTAGSSSIAIKPRVNFSGVTDIISDKDGEHQTLAKMPSEHQKWFNRISEHQKLSERASKYQKLSERANEHQKLYEKASEYQNLLFRASKYKKMSDRANKHQKMIKRTDEQQKLSPRLSVHLELLASVGEHPKLSRKKAVEVCRRCGEPDPGFPANKNISEQKDENYSYAYSATMSPAALIKRGENTEYSENSSVVSSEYSENSPTDSNIYEVIEQGTPECSELGSLYLNISRGRRDVLKLHRGVGWDCESVDGEGRHWDSEGGQGQDGHSRLLKIISQNSNSQYTPKHHVDTTALKHHEHEAVPLKKKEIQQPNQPEIHEMEKRRSLEKSKSLNIKKSLSRTLSSIVISIRKLF